VGRITEEQVDRLIDKLLRGEPVPRGTVMFALLCCEVQAERGQKPEEKRAA
jgi:hypothetical protein